mgnify:CR=1 FL=1
MKGYAKFLVKNAVSLALTLIIATYLTVIVANMGGYIDEVLRSQIIAEVEMALINDPVYQKLPPEEQQAYKQELIEKRLRAAGLYEPFWKRTLYYLRDALTLRLGRALFVKSWSGSQEIYVMLMERLPWSVLLFTTAVGLSIAVGIPIGLFMGRRALSKFDRAVTMAAIITYSFPGWFIGMLGILVFSFYLGIFPPGGLVSKPHPSYWAPEAIKDVLWHLALPLLSWLITGFGGYAYVTRNIVIHITHEDYVMAARAKGVPERLLITRYILRPAAPPIITMSALALVGSWTGAMITEAVFDWPGLGSLYWLAIQNYDAPVVIGITVLYGYLLVITVFLLNVIYGLLDPRVKTV